MKKIFMVMLLMMTFILSGCTQAAVNSPEAKGNLEISLFNIGQGDSILIRTKDQTILIDTANATEREQFVRELEKFSVTKIDKLIITHSHVDHIGNARMLIKPTEKQLAKYPYIKNVSVGEVYDNGVPFTNQSYRNYMKAVEATGIHRQSLKVGDTLDFGDGVKFQVLYPTAEYIAEMNSGKVDNGDRTYKMNNSSIVGRLTYKDFSMMLTGDCERESEAKIIESNKDLKCDILKAGHHGSKNSSSKNFIKAINPSYILISAGDKEKEGDGTPHLKLMERFSELGINPQNILCTRFNGSITVTTDGKTFSVKPEIKKDWVNDWVAKKKKNNGI